MFANVCESISEVIPRHLKYDGKISQNVCQFSQAYQAVYNSVPAQTALFITQVHYRSLHVQSQSYVLYQFTCTMVQATLGTRPDVCSKG